MRQKLVKLLDFQRIKNFRHQGKKTKSPIRESKSSCLQTFPQQCFLTEGNGVTSLRYLWREVCGKVLYPAKMTFK